MRTATMLSLVCAILLTGCAANGPSKEVGPAGGSITMDDVASIRVPAGAFSQPTKIGIERRSLRSTNKNVGLAGLLFNVERPANSELRIVAESSHQPAAAIDLQIDVPRDIGERRDEDDSAGPEATVLRVFARNVWESDAGGKLVTLEPLPGWTDPRSRTVTVSVPPHLFAETKDHKTAATVRLALTQLVAPPVPMEPHPADSPFATGDSTASRRSADDMNFAPPLEGNYRAAGAFGPAVSQAVSQFHPGVDLTPDASLNDTGREIHAMAAGAVAAAGEQVDHDDKAIGFGGFVVIGHGPVGAAPYTVYAGLDPQSIDVSQGDSVRRGDVIGRVAPSAQGRAAALHVEYVPRPTAANQGEKADPMASLGKVFVERLVAGYRSTALLRVPALDTDSDSIERVGNDADNGWWMARTDAKASDKIDGRTLAYQSKTSGEVETIVDRGGLRVHFSTEGQPRVEAGKHDASNPSEATASGMGGGRIRFMTTTAARYRLHVQYTVEGAGVWSIERRFQKAAEPSAKPIDVDKDFAAFIASGKEPAKFEQTFEGTLDEPGRFDFDFLPSIEIGGGSSRTAKLLATATLEVTMK